MRVSRPKNSAHMGRMDLHCRSLLPAGLRCFKVDARQGSHGRGGWASGFRLYSGISRDNGKEDGNDCLGFRV